MSILGNLGKILTAPNNDYTIKIIIDQESEPIICYLPEQVPMSSESDWSPFMDSLISTGSNVSTALSTAGYQLNPLITKIAAWNGNKPLVWTFSLQFNARTDPTAEVLMPIFRLLALTLPKALDNGLVQAPGPSIRQVLDSIKDKTVATKSASALLSIGEKLFESASTAASKLLGADIKTQRTGTGMVQVFVGNYLHMPNVIVTDVNPKFDTQFRYGIPISAECDITFQTLYPPTLDEVENMFVGLKSNRLGELFGTQSGGEKTTVQKVVDFIL